MEPLATDELWLMILDIYQYTIDKPLSRVVSYNTPLWERQLNRLI